jgi:hypothetical protein
MSEPEYVDPDDPFGDHSYKGRQRPKWTIPRHNNERKLLLAVRRKYYETPKHKSLNLEVVKAMVSLSTGIISKYPTEWVDHCCSWAVNKAHAKKPEYINWKGLLTFIHNEDAKNEFVERWLHKHQIEAHSEEDLYGSRKKWLDDE